MQENKKINWKTVFNCIKIATAVGSLAFGIYKYFDKKKQKQKHQEEKQAEREHREQERKESAKMKEESERLRSENKLKEIQLKAEEARKTAEFKHNLGKNVGVNKPQTLREWTTNFHKRFGQPVTELPGYLQIISAYASNDLWDCLLFSMIAMYGSFCFCRVSAERKYDENGER